MDIVKGCKLILLGCILCIVFQGYEAERKITIVTLRESPQEKFGAERLSAALQAHGYQVRFSGKPLSGKKPQVIVGSLKNHPQTAHSTGMAISREGFNILGSGKKIVIAGCDPNGVLYGCLELVDRLNKDGSLPEAIDFTDRPEMVMRGTCIGLQKTTYLPGRTVYEYPYRPENFPWFYDKELWVKYLDMMVENRYNSLYLWNGHPFASLVRLKEYPYAVEVNEETFRKNEEMFAFLTEEAGKRGIFVIQMFYNIIVSKPFAEHHGLKTQDRERPIIPLIADYTRKSIAAFIEKYPNVGLLVTLGEAMNTIDDDVEWFTKTILPGVKDGLRALGRNDEPPVVLRGHDTDAAKVMAAALPIYRNLYTMHKYNGESLTTYEPRDSWESVPRGLADIGTLHIANVHILANLEPFRYGSPDFIQKCVQAMENIQGAKGLHLYPQHSYWDWPFSADNSDPRLLEMDRDRIWYQAWGRYAWNGHRDRNEEQIYWSRVLGDYYGCGNAGRDILEAYEQTGEIAPKLLRTFGISDGNRQTLLLGMFMSQLVNPFKYNVYSNFWSSSGPEKEVLLTYAEKEWKGQAHTGEIPPEIIEDVVRRGEAAVKAIDRAAPAVTANQQEFGRLRNDISCYNTFAACFAEKVKAALHVLRYQYSNDISDLEKAVPFLDKSLEYYTELVRLTETAYLYANSMQTQQRRIPAPGINGTNKTWKELLPQYKAEAENFRQNVAKLKKEGSKGPAGQPAPFIPARITVLNPSLGAMPLKKGQPVFSDREFRLDSVAGELVNLSGIQFNNREQQEKGTSLIFENEKPVKLLVGYFNSISYSVLPPPALETNAAANDRGQADIKIANAMTIPGLYPVNVYSYSFPAGKNELVLGKGSVLILGFIDGNSEIMTRDAGVGTGVPAIDWLFY